MTALAAGRSQITPSLLKRKQFTLTSGTKAWHGGSAAVTRGTGKVVPATGAENEIVIGKFTESVDATLADQFVTVELPQEIVTPKYVNGTAANAIAATDLLSEVYALDDQTATIVAGGSYLGRFWGFDANGLVCVGPCPTAPESRLVGTLPAPVTGNIAIAATDIVNNGRYLLPSLAANTTVTLATSGVPDGTQITVIADGNQGAYTTTYRYGTTNITSPLTASKIHAAVLTKYGAIWSAAATAAP